MMRCFVEIDMGTMNQRQLAAKFERYHAWSESQRRKEDLTSLYSQFGAKQVRSVFRVLMVRANGSVGGGDSDPDRYVDSVSHLSNELQRRIWFPSSSLIAALGSPVLVGRILRTPPGWLRN